MRVEIRRPVTVSTTAEAVEAISAKLKGFERAHKMDSAVFYHSYKRGPVTADLDRLEWASAYELLLSYMGRMAYREDLASSDLLEGASNEAPSVYALAA